MIEIRHLRYFVALAEELHFGRAADRLHMAQSPLSHQIRQLEGDVGVELVSRAHRAVSLTDAGAAFLASARTILAELDQGTRHAPRASRGEMGTLVVGYVNEMTADLLPVSLNEFRQRFIDIELDLRTGTTGGLVDDLRRRRLDVAFVRSPRALDDSAMAYEQLITETLVVAFPQRHGAPKRRYAVAELADHDFVLPSFTAAEGLRKDVDIACAAAGFVPRVAREASPLSAILLLVAAGAGVALVPASAIHQYPVPGIDYRRFDDPSPVTTAGIAWRSGERSLVVDNFLTVTRRVAAGHQGQTDVWPERHIVELAELGQLDETTDRPQHP